MHGASTFLIIRQAEPPSPYGRRSSTFPIRQVRKLAEAHEQALAARSAEVSSLAAQLTQAQQRSEGAQAA